MENKGQVSTPKVRVLSVYLLRFFHRALAGGGDLLFHLFFMKKVVAHSALHWREADMFTKSNPLKKSFEKGPFFSAQWKRNRYHATALWIIPFARWVDLPIINAVIIGVILDVQRPHSTIHWSKFLTFFSLFGWFSLLIFCFDFFWSNLQCNCSNFTHKIVVSS